jgi:hypothetical protein
LLNPDGGAVGIGIVTPFATALHVAGVSTVASQIGQLQVGDTGTAAKRISIGYDVSPSIDAGWIQAIHGGVISKSLLLNPDGGNVAIAKTTADERLDVSGTIKSDRIKVAGTGYGLLNINTPDATAAISLHYLGVVAWQIGRIGDSLSISTTSGTITDTMGSRVIELRPSGQLLPGFNGQKLGSQTLSWTINAADIAFQNGYRFTESWNVSGYETRDGMLLVDEAGVVVADYTRPCKDGVCIEKP